MNRISRLFPIAAALLVCLVDCAHATRVEIPLPELCHCCSPASKSFSVSREAAFRFDRLPINVCGASVRLRGYQTPGSYDCDWFPRSAAYRMIFAAALPDTVTGGRWRAEIAIGSHLMLSPHEFEMASIYLAVLVVDADCQIAAESHTWGSIKALYADERHAPVKSIRHREPAYSNGET